MVTAAVALLILGGLWWIIGSRPRPEKGTAPELASGTGSSYRWDHEFSLNIVGESHYQREIKQCRPGELVTLLREPTNPHDNMAVRIDSRRGKQIGYLSSDRARWIGGEMDKGWGVEAHIQRIKGAGKATHGVVLRMRLIRPCDHSV